MAELTFSLAYSGSAVDDGTMDVAAVAPALLALADIFRTANRTLNRDAPEITLEITATSRGSFEVNLLLTQPDILGQLVEFFSGSQATALANLYGIVTAGGLQAMGLFHLIKWVAGRTIARRQPIDVGSVRIELQDGVSITIPAPLLALFDSIKVRRDVETVVAPLDSDGVDSLEIRRSAEEVSVRVEKQERESFRAPAQSPALREWNSRSELSLQLVALSFREANLWRLTDGNQTYFARIDDQDFLERVASSHEDFRSGDVLHVVLRTHQVQAADGSLRATYTIEKVLDHIRSQPETQLRLDIAEDPTSESR